MEKSSCYCPKDGYSEGGYDAKVRAYLLNNDWVESIINLPAGILKYTAIPSAIIILNKNKFTAGVIKFIDATGFGNRERQGVSISKENIQLIAELVEGKHLEALNFKSVLLPEVIKNGSILNVSHYIEQESTWTPPDIEQEMKALKQRMNDFDTAQERLIKLLSK